MNTSHMKSIPTKKTTPKGNTLTVSLRRMGQHGIRNPRPRAIMIRARVTVGHHGSSRTEDIGTRMVSRRTVTATTVTCRASVVLQGIYRRDSLMSRTLAEAKTLARDPLPLQKATETGTMTTRKATFSEDPLRLRAKQRIQSSHALYSYLRLLRILLHPLELIAMMQGLRSANVS